MFFSSDKNNQLNISILWPFQRILVVPANKVLTIAGKNERSYIVLKKPGIFNKKQNTTKNMKKYEKLPSRQIDGTSKYNSVDCHNKFIFCEQFYQGP